MSSTQHTNSTSKGSTKSLMISRKASIRVWLNEKDSRYYKMDHSKRGIAVIFNQEHFDLNLDTRFGSRADYNFLVDVLKNLGFHVWKRLNFTREGVEKTLKTVAKVDHSENDCLIIVVLSYGRFNYLYAADACYKADLLFNYFTADKCPTLAGKPKLFFIQACSCDAFDSGITPVIQGETGGLRNAFCIERDFLIFYSTVPGHYSWHIANKTWFIEALCLELRKNGTHYNLVTLLTFVCHSVTSDYWPILCNKLTEKEKKQNPCIISMLTRLVKFSPKK